jgi:hypothetical protein
MNGELLAFGVILFVLGAAQTWLRHGPWAKELRESQVADASLRADRAAAAVRDATDDADTDALGDDIPASGQPDPATAKADRRSKGLFSAWTAILGPVSMTLGIALAILGVLGY